MKFISLDISKGKIVPWKIIAPRKIAPYPNSNHNPNPNPRGICWGRFSSGGNFPAKHHTKEILYAIQIPKETNHIIKTKRYTFSLDDPFYNYSTITRTFTRTDYTDFYEKYFFKHETLRKDLENSHIKLHSKKTLNL